MRLTPWATNALVCAVGDNAFVSTNKDRVHRRGVCNPGQVVYNLTHSTPFPPSRTRQKTMESGTPNDINVLVTYDCQISPGCLTADAVLEGHSSRHQRSGSPPTSPRRKTFATIDIPTRTRNPWTELHPGSFILFQLDRREYARQFLIPEDSELFERCLEFPAKRYAGLVVGAFPGGSDPDAEEYCIAFVSKSPPPASGPNPDPDSFAVPIAPMGPDNANSRQPLAPRPFPWAGCYQYTVLGARISPTLIIPSAIEHKLSEEDFDAFDAFVFDDRTTLDNQWDCMSSVSDEPSLFEDMRMSDTTPLLPVKVWSGLIAEKECHDPREFAEEVFAFRELALTGMEE